jgi:transposase-like protein
MPRSHRPYPPEFRQRLIELVARPHLRRHQIPGTGVTQTVSRRASQIRRCPDGPARSLTHCGCPAGGNSRC